MDTTYPVGFLMYNVVCKMKHVVLKGIFKKVKEQYIGTMLSLLNQI